MLHQKGIAFIPVVIWSVIALAGISTFGVVAVKSGLLTVNPPATVKTPTAVYYPTPGECPSGQIYTQTGCLKLDQVKGVSSQITPKPTQKSVYVNPDPVIDCTSSYPNCNGQSIKAKRSECSKITCCQVGDKWSVYPSNDQCEKAQDAVYKQTQPSNIQNTYIVPSYAPIPNKPLITCVITYPCTGNSFTYQYDVESCNLYKQQAIDRCPAPAASPTQTPMTEDQAQSLIDQHNRQVTQCQSDVRYKYQGLLQSCSQYGSSSAAEACTEIYEKKRQSEYDGCGTIY